MSLRVSYVNPERRKLLKQLAALGIAGSAGISGIAPAQTAAGIDAAIAVARRGDQRYETLRERSLWRSNLPARFPDVIVEAASVEDLREALRFARDNDLQVVCRASGHATAGAPLRNGGMMIYVSQLNSVAIDPDTRTATVGPGATMAALYGTASRYGLDFPTADCSTVAVAGFILGGGFGRNCMHLTKGPVCNALISADVMLESGEIVTASESSHADLFWAMRGCGPAFFGIITRMTLRLFDPPGAYMSSSYRYPLAALADLIGFLDEHSAQQDDQVSNRVSIQPDADEPANAVAMLRVTTFADAGPDAEGQARARLGYYASAGLRDAAIDVTEYVTQQISSYMITSDPTAGTHTDNVFTDHSSSLLAASHLMLERPAGFSIHLDLGHNHQFYPSSDEQIAFSAAGRHFLTTYVDWKDTTAERNAQAYEWAQRFAGVAAQYGQGNYLNQVDTGLYPERIRQSFSAAAWQRLAEVRQHYDASARFFSYVGPEADV